VILVDTSVWIDHLRWGDQRLTDLLVEGQVLCHPFVVGELACGSLKRRAEILALLGNLPHAPAVDHAEALSFIDTHTMMGTGLGWVDVHLLASTRLGGARLWTRDRRLAQASRRLGVAA
jgi:predicted nucleic acid-binding protein